MTNDTTDIYYAPQKDIDFFNRVTAGLPKAGVGLDSNGEPMPHACGAHSVRCFREIVEIVKPKEILEIGTCAGYSAAMWLELTKARVVSCDISTRKETAEAVQCLLNENRFGFIRGDSGKLPIDLQWHLRNRGFELIFIDGDHSEQGVVADIQLAITLNIKYLAFDDWLPQYGPGVQSAIKQFPQLEEVKILGNIALFRNTSI